ncbi:hypothetical protein [Kushneria aurantia]|uniref:Tetratricopeptide repeat protein n=1 Tax=Kushneria aurantia TaxID=504092 RepID=A0ABV6G6Y0_9GAMM|nr:hypothetical protein [Kushneria aurantia]
MRTPSATARRLLKALAIGLALTLATPVLAQGPALSQSSVDRLRTLERQLESGDYARVLESARSRAADAGSSGAEQWSRALYLQLAASAARHLGNPGEAADLLGRARGVAAAPYANRLEWLTREARLRLQAGELSRAAELFDRWRGQAQLPIEDLWLGAQLHARLEQWSQALDWVEAARGRDSSPSDDHLSLAATVYQQSGQLDRAGPIAEAQLTGHRDDPERWRQTVALYQRLGANGRAAALWEAGWQRGVLSGPEALLTRARLHLDGGTPARAGEILAQALETGQIEDSLDNRRLLARAWAKAREREKALDAWRQLAERSNAPGDWQQLGELAYGWGAWERARQGLARARQLGSDTPGQLALMEGVAAYEMGQISDARQAFTSASSYDDSAVRAQQWLALLATEASGSPSASPERAS